MSISLRRFSFVLITAVAACGGDPAAPDLGFLVEAVGSIPATAVPGSSITVTARVLRRVSGGANTPVSGRTVTLAVTSGGGTINGSTTATVTTQADGTVSATWILGATAGTQTVRASVSATEFLDFTVTAIAQPSQLVLQTAPPGSAQSGVILSPQPSIQLKDASGANVPQAGVPVSVTIETGGGTLAGTTTVATNASGLAVFTDLSISGTIGNRTLRFSATLGSSNVNVLSGAIALAAGPASQIVLTTAPPANAPVGVPLAPPPGVQLRDAAGNDVSQAGVPVTVAIETGGGTLAGTATVATNASGLATFPNLTINGTPGTRTLRFSATLSNTARTVISGPIALASVPSQLTIETQPSATTPMGFPLLQQPTVQVRDAAGNPVAQAGIVVTATIATGGALGAFALPASAVGGGITATTNATGLAVFSNLRLIGAVGPKTLRFSATLGGQQRTVVSSTIQLTLAGNGKLLFKSNDDELWVSNPDGTGRTQLTQGYGNSNCLAGDEEPQWSPDGTRIVFTRTQNGSQEVWVMNADGSNQTQLTVSGDGSCLESTFSENPSWSPDGTKIIFTTDRSTTTDDEDLWIMNADGTNQVKLTGLTTRHESEAFFSPDGSTIVFQVEPINNAGCDIGGVDGGELWLMNADGTNARRMTTISNCSFDENYTWSPDGRKIAFTKSTPALACYDEVFVIDVDGTNPLQLTNCLSNNGSEHPAWSPDGTSILFANGSGGDTIWIMNTNGSGQVIVGLGALIDNGQPAWQPIRP